MRFFSNQLPDEIYPTASRELTKNKIKVEQIALP
jgi:hypothetical protein